MTEKIAIVGLGYVGLPLAVELAKSYPVKGFDIKKERVEELKQHYDSTNEVSSEELKKSTLFLITEEEDIKDCTIFIVTVPTPVDSHNNPDLKPVISASETVGKFLKYGNIVVYESTVYPGVTEEICSPILENISGLRSGEDFFLGYSPERINPGDSKRTLRNIVKVVAGQTPEIAQKLASLYGSINEGKIFIAANIKTAEAAKVIENAQRDINIAFINEITMIFNKMGISIYDVLKAASTKWNFLPFVPGLVGGHCIGVDPFYLAYASRKLGHNPEVILSGRRINDRMGAFFAQCIDNLLGDCLDYGQSGKVLILGLTFKENVPDLRNTKVIDMMRHLQAYGHTVEIHDPRASKEEAEQYYGVHLRENWQELVYDAIVLAVGHTEYLKIPIKSLEKNLNKGGVIADLKKIWAGEEISSDIRYWTL
jgi:UDP-N-acetyl-D-galactosamine dehydrogenase